MQNIRIVFFLLLFITSTFTSWGQISFLLQSDFQFNKYSNQQFEKKLSALWKEKPTADSLVEDIVEPLALYWGDDSLSNYTNENVFPKPKRHPWIAAAEVVGFDLALHLFDRYALDAEYAQVTFDTIKYNLRHGFVWDNDNLSTNLFWHPYTGGLYFNAARSNGLNFWQSIPYAFGGSFLWECFAESEPPSFNDMIATPIGGIALGEITHRISHLILDDSKRGWERFGRELLAGIISPMDLLNRVMRGDAWRYRPIGIYGESYYLRQPFLFDISTFPRFFEDVDGNKGNLSWGAGFKMLYGQAFIEEKRKPYDYFMFDMNINIIGDQPFISNVSMIGLIWGKEWNKKAHSWLGGVFQHFDYYDSAPLVKGVKQPYEFAETASFGGGFLYKYQKEERTLPRFLVSFYANAILLGASESDYYFVDQRNYNMGSGYSVKFQGTLFLGKRWSFNLEAKHYYIFTSKGYGSAENEVNGLPKSENFHYANVQGNRGYACLSMTTQRIDYRLSRKFKLSFEQLTYFRKTHYNYLGNVESTSTESRLILTYNILRL